RHAAMRPVGAQAELPRAATLELLLAEHEEEGPCLIARRVRQLLDQQPPVRDRDRGEDRPLRPSDVAILLRSRPRLREIEEQLTRAQVPYMVSGGQGYFTRPE